MEKITIKDVLINCEKFEWSDALFLPEAEVWSLETQGIIWDPDDVEDDEEEYPEVAKENKLFCSISIQTIQGIVDNAKQQVKACSIEQLFDAFLFYWDHDAFITFDKK